MVKRKEILNYITKTPGDEIHKDLMVKLIKDIYDSVGKCKRCEYYSGECELMNIEMDKNDYCSKFTKKLKEV